MGYDSIADKVVAIAGSGAGPGIGRELAVAFARVGARLSLNLYREDDQDVDALHAELGQTGSSVITYNADISSEENADEFVARTLAAYGRLDVLVNNTGISTQALAHEMPLDVWQRMIDVNLTSIFLTTRAALRVMIPRRSGRIINVASQIAQKGGVEHAHYAAAKAGVIAFTKSVALEVGDKGITANCIAPGPIDTRMMASVHTTWKERKKAELALPQFGVPPEVAPTALFLAAEPEGNLYTGQTLGPNCGDVMP